MNPAYFETRFRTNQVVDSWPDEFVILSAYASTGERWTPEQNAIADRTLVAELRARSGWLPRIVGYSPASDHAEPSWAVRLSLGDAREIGLRFRQDAIYHVREDLLSVTHCDAGAVLVPVGSFRALLDHDL